MKRLIGLVAIATISSVSFANVNFSATSVAENAFATAWQHQEHVTVSEHNLTMVYGGQDISSRSIIDGAIADA